MIAARAFALLLVLAGPLSAEPLSDMIFAPVEISAAAPADALRYHHRLAMPQTGEAAAAPLDSTDILTLRAEPRGDTVRLVLERELDGKTTPISEFAEVSAHPILIYFLESTVRHMTEVTGGSPYYIRNRMREVLGAAELGSPGPVTVGALTVQGYDVVMTPFAQDKMRDRMGEFAQLTLHFVVAPGHPARLLHLSADTIASGGGYHESMIVMQEGE